MPKYDLLIKLHGGKRNSIGEAVAVANIVLAKPELFEDLFDMLKNEDSLIRMRAAYAISKIADSRPDLLQPHKDHLLDYLADPGSGHLARACMLQALHKMPLTAEDISLLKDMLRGFMFSDSSIVKTLSLHMLVEFADNDPSLRSEVIPILWQALECGTPAMRARARKLMKKYKL